MPLNPFAEEWTPTISPPPPPPPQELLSKSNRKQRTRRKNNKVQDDKESKPQAGKWPKNSKVQDDKPRTQLQAENVRKQKSLLDDEFPSLTQTNSAANDTGRQEGQQLTYLELAQKQLIQPLTISESSVDVGPVGWFSSRSCRRWDNINKPTPAVDSSSDDDDNDIVTSVDCTALIPEQQIVSHQSVVVEYPTVCQTSANKSAIAR